MVYAPVDPCDSTRIYEVSGDPASKNNIAREQRNPDAGRIGAEIRRAWRQEVYDNDLTLQRLCDGLPKPIEQQLVLEDGDGSATCESVKRRANNWKMMNSTGRADMDLGTMENGRDSEDDDGGQDRDSSGDFMGLKREKKQKERDSTMDIATGVDHGDTRQRIASRRRQ